MSLFVAAVCLLGLTGCDPAPAIYSPAPAPSSTPIFKSDEEALAAAKEAYERYLEITNNSLNDDGLSRSKLDSVMTGEMLEISTAKIDEAIAKGYHNIGGTALKSISLQQYDRQSRGKSLIVVYACEDVSGVNFVDSEGNSLVSDDRKDTTLFETTFDLETDRKTVLISRHEPWSDQSC